MLRNRHLSFWTPVNFEVEYFLSDETDGVLTDTVIYFYDQHLAWLSQLKPAVSIYKIGWGGGPSLQESLPAQVIQTYP